MPRPKYSNNLKIPCRSFGSEIPEYLKQPKGATF